MVMSSRQSDSHRAPAALIWLTLTTCTREEYCTYVPCRSHMLRALNFKIFFFLYAEFQHPAIYCSSTSNFGCPCFAAKTKRCMRPMSHDILEYTLCHVLDRSLGETLMLATGQFMLAIQLRQPVCDVMWLYKCVLMPCQMLTVAVFHLVQCCMK